MPSGGRLMEENGRGLSNERNGANSTESAAAKNNAQLAGTHDSSGDTAFLNECRRHLNANLITMSTELVHAFRSRHPGNMVEGQARKWVNHPSRSVALKIQILDQSLVVSVKGRPDDFTAPTLRIKKGWRPNWSEFKLKHSEQLEDAIRVVLASAAGGRGS